MPLIHTLQIDDPDGFYDELVSAQREMSDEQAQTFMAKLVLLLANHIGDRQVLSEAVTRAARLPAQASPAA